jgi:hypothetical protein
VLARQLLFGALSRNRIASSGGNPAPVATGFVPDRTTAVHRLLQLLSDASARYSTPPMRTTFDSVGTMICLLQADASTLAPAARLRGDG